MKKLALFVTLTIATLAAVTASEVRAGGEPCKTTKFETEFLKQACEKGGQQLAKDEMKKFMKEKNIKNCKACHTKLAPNYELKTDGLEQFKKAGGK